MTAGWSIYVNALVALNVAGCVWLLWWTGKRRPGDSAPEQTSHTWDGDITEYNKPLPRWWINLFYLTIVFSLGYLAWYPGAGSFTGFSGWTSQAEHARDKAAGDARLAATFAPFEGQALPVLAANPAALALGKSIFGNHCATCHGSGGRGAAGYPNLTDTVWHWGGNPEQVLHTVLDGRVAAMPEWGTTLTAMGGPGAVADVVAYVRSLSGTTGGDEAAPARGAPLFAGICAACHGADAKGNALLGAPDLTDAYWLYGSSPEAIAASITKGRNGVMPAHGPLLGETRARLAAAYAWSLSPHEPAAPATPPQASTVAP